MLSASTGTSARPRAGAEGRAPAHLDGPPRLLFVVNQARFFVSHRLPLAVGAAAAGYDVHVAVPDGPAVDVVAGAGFAVHHVPFDRGGMSARTDARTMGRLARLYRALRPDVVHHVTVKPVLYGSLAARACGVPAVVNAVPGLGSTFLAQGAAARARRALLLRLYRHALAHPNARVIFQNPDDRRVLEAARVVAPRQAVLIRGSGVDLERFSASPLPVGSPPLVILPARMLRDKGVTEFVEAARLLRGRGIAVRCVLVGAPDPENPSSLSVGRLTAWAAAGDVEWWGERADMPAVLAAASVVCLPSYGEGVPKTLLEAAACGRPMVTTDVPGCREVVRPDIDGLLAAPRSAASVADAIERLVTAPRAVLARMGGAARERAEREFGVGAVVEATLAVYRDLLALRPGRLTAVAGRGVLA